MTGPPVSTWAPSTGEEVPPVAADELLVAADKPLVVAEEPPVAGRGAEDAAVELAAADRDWATTAAGKVAPSTVPASETPLTPSPDPGSPIVDVVVEEGLLLLARREDPPHATPVTRINPAATNRV